MQEIQPMTFKELKEVVQQLEALQVSDETKIFLDTGWDSIQEIAPDALTIGEAQQFVVEDEWTKEKFNGLTLVEKAEKMNEKLRREQEKAEKKAAKKEAKLAAKEERAALKKEKKKN